MLTKEEVRGVLRVIVILASVFVLILYCALVGMSYMRIAYGVDGATSDRIATFLRPARIALFFASPAAFAAFISAVSDYKSFQWVAIGALAAFISVIVSVSVFW